MRGATAGVRGPGMRGATAGVRGPGMRDLGVRVPRWLELGCGDGAFTLALAEVLGPGALLVAIDRDAGALEVMASRVGRQFPDTQVEARRADFTQALPRGPFDGVLAANSLHFVADRRHVLEAIRAALTPGGRLIVVEYDADAGNQWVPFPFSFESWRREAAKAGFHEPTLLHRVPSRFLGAIYGAACSPAGA
jgi:SAM-dependent methyltransferase